MAVQINTKIPCRGRRYCLEEEDIRQPQASRKMEINIWADDRTYDIAIIQGSATELWNSRPTVFGNRDLET